MKHRTIIKVVSAAILMTATCYSQQSIKDLQAKVTSAPHDTTALLALGIAYHNEGVAGRRSGRGRRRGRIPDYHGPWNGAILAFAATIMWADQMLSTGETAPSESPLAAGDWRRSLTPQQRAELAALHRPNALDAGETADPAGDLARLRGCRRQRRRDLRAYPLLDRHRRRSCIVSAPSCTIARTSPSSASPGSIARRLSLRPAGVLSERELPGDPPAAPQISEHGERSRCARRQFSRSAPACRDLLWRAPSSARRSTSLILLVTGPFRARRASDKLACVIEPLLMLAFYTALFTLAARYRFGARSRRRLGLGAARRHAHRQFPRPRRTYPARPRRPADPLRVARTVETSPFVSFFLNNLNYHLEHHLYPGIPWNNLPKVHRVAVAGLRARPGRGRRRAIAAG